MDDTINLGLFRIDEAVISAIETIADTINAEVSGKASKPSKHKTDGHKKDKKSLEEIGTFFLSIKNLQPVVKFVEIKYDTSRTKVAVRHGRIRFHFQLDKGELVFCGAYINKQKVA